MLTVILNINVHVILFHEIHTHLNTKQKNENEKSSKDRATRARYEDILIDFAMIASSTLYLSLFQQPISSQLCNAVIQIEQLMMHEMNTHFFFISHSLMCIMCFITHTHKIERTKWSVFIEQIKTRNYLYFASFHSIFQQPNYIIAFILATWCVLISNACRIWKYLTKDHTILMETPSSVQSVI